MRAFAEFIADCPEIALLFVDDGSTDNTPLMLERLRQAHPQQIYTMRLGRNFGKAEAVRRGIQAAIRRAPDFVGYFDADLAAPLGEIPRLVNVLRTRPTVQLTMGSRVALLGREIQRSGWRHLLGRVFATTASYILGLPVYDSQCGAKLFRVTPELAAIFAQPFLSRWIFDVEILARVTANARNSNPTVDAGNLIYESPLDRWRDVGGSRLKPWDFVVAARDLVTIYRRYIWRAAVQRQAAARIANGGEPEREQRHAA